jgi:hypothetical protein
MLNSKLQKPPGHDRSLDTILGYYRIVLSPLLMSNIKDEA